MDSAHPISAVLEQVIDRLAPRASMILLRDPPLDPDLQAASDLDLLVFGPVAGILPERLDLDLPQAAYPPIDLIWLPEDSLLDPEKFAANGLIAHRLLGSRLIFDKNGLAPRQVEAVRAWMYQPEVQVLRLTGFFEMGYLTAREVGVTWDFPGLALFWVLVAHTACLAAMVDALGGLCPNVYTRPFSYLHDLENTHGLNLTEPFRQALHLDANAMEMIAPLTRIQRIISGRFPEPDWPANIRPATRYEFRYFLSKAEVDWRIRAAEEMVRQGNSAAAVIYLRFLAYSLARLPMVHQRALEGVDVSYVRPERAVRPDLNRLCPEILPDLDLIFGGPDLITVEQVQDSLKMLAEWRWQSEVVIRSQGIVLVGLRPWEPYRAGG